MANKDVLVVGAGLGGMAAAISLQAKGYQVKLLEKNGQLGGKLNFREMEGFGFDLGPSIFTLPRYFNELFELAGKKREDYFSLQPVTPHWRNFFEDKTTIDLHQEQEAMQAELSKLPGDAQEHWRQLQEFLAYARAQYNIVEEGYFDQGLDNLWEFIRYYGFKRLGKEIDYKPSMAESIATRLDDPKLRSIFEYFIKYVGSSALQAPGYMNLMPIIQFDYGLWYVQGGMYELANALGKLLEDLGVEVELNAEVEKITHSGRKITGVKLANGQSLSADLVVSNMEVIPCYEKLLGMKPSFLRKFKRFEPACSGIVLHLGTNREFPQLAHHNFFFSENQHKHFHTVFEQKRIPEDPTLYVVAPTRTDSSKAPNGADNIKILPHIPPLPETRFGKQEGHDYSQEDYEALAERCIDKMERCGIEGLRDSIVVRDLMTPVDLQKMYFSNRGSIYGVVTNWKQNFGFKAPKVSRKFSGLYFCGGSTNPGGGMPMAILSGMKVAQRVEKHQPLG